MHVHYTQSAVTVRLQIENHVLSHGFLALQFTPLLVALLQFMSVVSGLCYVHASTYNLQLFHIMTASPQAAEARGWQGVAAGAGLLRSAAPG